MFTPSKTATSFADRIDRRLRELELKKLSDPTAPPDPAAESQHRAAHKDSAQLDELENILARAQEIAAVSGKFNPSGLFTKDTSDDSKRMVLSQLSPFCLIETATQEVTWFLMQTYRSQVLSEILTEKNLSGCLNQELPETDRFGQFLRSILRGEPVDIAGIDPEALPVLMNVLESIADLDAGALALNGVNNIPPLEDVRKLLKKESFLDDYNVLLENGFYGRQEELQHLYKFLHSPRAQLYPYWTGLLLTGNGGAGKTTLLAKFVRDVAARHEATIAILDFDRPGIDARDGYWLESEISRQIGQQYPELADELREARHSARREKENYQQFQYLEAGLESSDRVTRLIFFIQSALERIGALDKPFLLVLDTFEEVAQPGFCEQIKRWLSEFGDVFSSTGVKVVFSGRIFDDDHSAQDSDFKLQFANMEFLPPIEVKELEPDAALQFLVGCGVGKHVAERLVGSGVVPLRPLEMKLIAELINQSPESVEDLEDELRKGGDSAKELFSGIVYRRILLRIRNDEMTRRLACPGLTLRYITRPLIQQVLIPALDLPRLGDEEADAALRKLAAYRWLTSEPTPGEIWHRKDLRRSTLKAMLGEDPKTCEQISRLAAEYFDSMGDEKARAESTYHRLMLVRGPNDGANLEEADLKKARPHIGADIVDLPPAASALLRYVAEKKIPLHEIELLPPRYLRDAYHDTGQALFAGREYRHAEKLIKRGREAGIALKPDGYGCLSQWETDTLFATASWKELTRASRASKKDGLAPTVEVLARRLYPQLIIDPSVYSDDELGKLLYFQNEPNLQDPKMTESDAVFITARIVFTLITAISRTNFAKHWFPPIGKFLEKTSKFSSVQSAMVLRRRMAFLACVPEGRKDFDLSMAPSNVRLDPQWFSDFRLFCIDHNVDERLKDMTIEIETLYNQELEREDNRTVTNFLGGIDASKQGDRLWRQVMTNLDLRNLDLKQFESLFRGPDPEFRDPCRFALLEAYAERDTWPELRDLLASVIQLDLDDLKPDKFTEVFSANPEFALQRFVELVDRKWELGTLLDRARADNYERSTLYAVKSSYSRWDSAVRLTFSRKRSW